MRLQELEELEQERGRLAKRAESMRSYIESPSFTQIAAYQREHVEGKYGETLSRIRQLDKAIKCG